MTPTMTLVCQICLTGIIGLINIQVSRSVAKKHKRYHLSEVGEVVGPVHRGSTVGGGKGGCSRVRAL